MTFERIRAFGIGILLGAFLVGFFQSSEKNETVLEIQYSRAVMEYAEDIVREKKPTPPMSARFYAYVASVYYEILANTKDQAQAVKGVFTIIDTLYPDTKVTPKNTALLAFQNVSLNAEATRVLTKYEERMKTDADTSLVGERLVGDPYWVGENPFEPSAGNWKRWNTEGITFSVPPPPVFQSTEYKKALREVEEAAEGRSSKEGEIVNFWGGVPGTEAPAGIWQNRLYDVTKSDSLSDESYAYAQMILAQTLADAFMECWKTKYIYWTKRPSMVDGSINLSMNNPPFPSYVSGHSTISRAAAEVLTVLFPQHKDVWLHDAAEAKNSRLWAGIHFPYDNEVGAELGRQVGEEVVKRLTLEAI
jgi:hypothetical protein